MAAIVHLFGIDSNSHAAPSPNRSTKPSLSEVPHRTSTPLIDTIRVTGRINNHTIPHWNLRQRVDPNGELAECFASSSVRLSDVTVQVRPGRDGLIAVMEKSLPTLLHGHNVYPVNVTEAIDLVADLHSQASEYVDWIDGPSQLRVNRLDLDKTFQGVRHLPRLLDGLMRVQVPRTTNPRLYCDKNNGNALTLERGTASRTWRAVLYDKSAQMQTRVRRERDPLRKAHLQRAADQCRNHVRFEAQLHTDALRRTGVTIMADLNDEILLTLRKDYFRRAKFDTPVGGAPRLQQVQTNLATAGDPNYKFFGSVWGMLSAEALGLPQPIPSPGPLARYRCLAKDWGLTAADVLTEAGPAVALDFDSGTLRAAS